MKVAANYGSLEHSASKSLHELGSRLRDKDISEAEALPRGSVLGGRYRIESVLSEDAFVKEYLALDLRREEPAYVTELYVKGCKRSQIDNSGNEVHWPAILRPWVFRFRHMFMDQARALARSRVLGIAAVRDVFSENGTAYVVTEFPRDYERLSHHLKNGTLSPNEAAELFRNLLDTLDSLHGANILHRNISPESILVRDDAMPKLVRFGHAREWLRDALSEKRPQSSSEMQDVARFLEEINERTLFAPEQTNPKAKRGARTDLFLLAAALYRTLTGVNPEFQEVSGANTLLVGLKVARPDLPESLTNAVSQALQIPYAARPSSAAELTALLEGETLPKAPQEALESYDEKAVRLMAFRFGRRECPACGGLLESYRALPKGMCPVCRTHALRRRTFEHRNCPICKLGILHRIRNDRPLKICAICRTGVLQNVRKKILSLEFDLRCAKCEALYHVEGPSITLAHFDKDHYIHEDSLQMSADQWRRRSGRSNIVMICESCDAQLDVCDDGSWQLVTPERTGKPSRHRPEEWARIAIGLKSGAGNTECGACGAEFDVKSGLITLLSAQNDPYKFAESYLYRALSTEDARWLGVGKQSHLPGLVCEDCGTEFDRDPNGLKLIQTDNKALLGSVGKVLSRENWHRASRYLPLTEDEDRFEADFDRALLEAFETGEVDYSVRGDKRIAWKSKSTLFLVKSGRRRRFGAGKLSVTNEDLVFRSLVRTHRVAIDKIRDVQAIGPELGVHLDDISLAFDLPQLELKAKLRSGKRTVPISAENLAKRLRAAKK